jgi:hypothetical protein
MPHQELGIGNEPLLLSLLFAFTASSQPIIRHLGASYLAQHLCTYAKPLRNAGIQAFAADAGMAAPGRPAITADQRKGGILGRENPPKSAFSWLSP